MLLEATMPMPPGDADEHPHVHAQAHDDDDDDDDDDDIKEPTLNQDHTKTLKLPPSMWCISYQQLMEVGQLAKGRFKDDAKHYSTKVTTRDVCREIIEPMCRETGKSYALALNPQGLPIDVFVTHSWDGIFSSLITSIRFAFQTNTRKPNLWICAFALVQGDSLAISEQIGIDASTSSSSFLEDTPFVKAIQEARYFCVVRNADTDLYTRIWCVCELMYAHRQGLFPESTYVTGPDAFRDAQTSCLDAKATKMEDKDRILDVMLTTDGYDFLEIDKIVRVFRRQEAPQGVSQRLLPPPPPTTRTPPPPPTAPLPPPPPPKYPTLTYCLAMVGILTILSVVALVVWAALFPDDEIATSDAQTRISQGPTAMEADSMQPSSFSVPSPV